MTLDGAPRTVTTDLEAPWSVVFRDDTALVSERDSGRILELLADGSTRVVGTIAGVASGGEAGLLGIAVDDRGRLYVYYTGKDGNRIERYELTGTPGSLSLGAAVTLVDGIPSASFHDGGRIAFGRTACCTPPPATPARAAARRTASRSPARSCARRPTATSRRQPVPRLARLQLRPPQPAGPRVVQQWEPADASPSEMAAIDGTLLIASLCGEVLRAVPIADPSSSSDYYAGEYGRIRHVTRAPDGDLWFVTNNTDGRGDPGAGDDRILTVRPSR